jgi:hypothetical protein
MSQKKMVFHNSVKKLQSVSSKKRLFLTPRNSLSPIKSVGDLPFKKIKGNMKRSTSKSSKKSIKFQNKVVEVEIFLKTTKKDTAKSK